MIPVSRPKITDQDIRSVERAVISTFVAGGPFIPEFEMKVAKFCGRKYGVAVTNGTNALTVALAALNLPKGNKVLLPTFTIVSPLYAIINQNYTPVFADVDGKTWNVEVETILQYINKGIDAAIIAQTYASSPNMVKIESILKKARILFIEDAAEGFGGRQNNRPFGSFGDISILSFYSNKLITTGEGGMVLTDRKDIYDELCLLRNLYFDKKRTFRHQKLSGNYRMTNYQAALGLSQLKRIEKFYKHRKKLYLLYLKLLGGLEKYIQFQVIPPNTESSYWVFPIILKKSVKIDSTKFIKLLETKGIETRHFFYPLDRQPFLKLHGYNFSTYTQSKISFMLWQRGLYLPVGNGITETEVTSSSNIVRELILKYH